jgi:outer membrane protein assembly factor BamE
MSQTRQYSLFLASVALALCTLGGCSGYGDKAVNLLSPYRADIVQGNVVTREQLAALKPGMSRMQVRDVLGSVLLTSVFHANRWDYVFTLKRQGAEPQLRRVTVLFKDDAMQEVIADELPSEADFVASLKSLPVTGKPPVLEASQEALSKFPAPVRAEPADTTVPAPAVTYPPLEPARY